MVYLLVTRHPILLPYPLFRWSAHIRGAVEGHYRQLSLRRSLNRRYMFMKVNGALGFFVLPSRW
ncbi:hypothetical protein YC2023_075024 [Brassica napus]